MSDKAPKSPTHESIMLEGASGSFVYELTCKKVKNINLRVVGGKVLVSAPASVPIERISRFVLQNESFIRRALDAQTERLDRRQETDYADGGVFYYLGRPLRLSLSKGKRRVSLAYDRLEVSLSRPDDQAAVRSLLLEWISNETLAVAERLCLAHLPELAPTLQKLPTLEARTMRRRLGSCCPALGRVTLARPLACLPLECVEYVVLHELCHFLHADHSKDFYSALGQLLPKHKELRRITSELCERYFPS